MKTAEPGGETGFMTVRTSYCTPRIDGRHLMHGLLYCRNTLRQDGIGMSLCCKVVLCFAC